MDKLLEWNFEECTEPLAATELGEHQRDVLTLLSQDVHGANFRGYGIPEDTRSRRRWLGLDPPGVLERIVTAERAPLWKVLMPFLREHMAADPAPPLHASMRTFLHLRGVELTDDEWMDLWVERDAGAYGLPDHAPFPPAEEPDCLPTAAVIAGAIRWLERIPTDAYELRWTSGALFATLARAMTGEIPPALDRAFNFCGRPALVREGFTALPPERRERIAEGALGDPRCTNVSLLASFPELAPRAAQRLEQLSARGHYEPLERSDDARFLEHIRAMPPLRGLNAD